jgi:hypothetical protein
MKIFVVGMHCSGKQELFEYLEDDGVQCGKLFSNTDVNDIRYEFFTDKDINEIFENSAYIFLRNMHNDSDTIEGMSLYEYDNNDVFILSPSQFTAIQGKELNKDFCLVWLDNSKATRRTRYVEERRIYNFNQVEQEENTDLDNFIDIVYNNKKAHLIYFNDEDIARVSTVIYSITKYPELIKKFEKTFR